MKELNFYTTQVELEVLKHLQNNLDYNYKINLLRTLELFKGLSYEAPLMKSVTERKIYHLLTRDDTILTKEGFSNLGVDVLTLYFICIAKFENAYSPPKYFWSEHLLDILE